MDYFLKRSLISNFESVCRKGNEQEINTAIEEYIEVIANEPENTYEKLCLQLVDVIMKTNDRPFFKQERIEMICMRFPKMEKIALKFLSINHVIMMWKLQADNYDELELFVDDIKRVTERISESKAVAEKCIENLDFILYLNNLGYQSDSIKTAPVLEMIEQLREKFADK